MCYFGWLFVIAVGACQQLPVAVSAGEDNAQPHAITRLRDLGVKIQVDEKAPGKPAIEADFSALPEGVTAQDLAPVRQLTSLRRATVACMRLTDHALVEHLSSLATLESLFFNDTHVSDEDLERLSRLPQLKELHMAHCLSVTERGLKHLGKLKTLEDLQLNDMPQKSDAWLSELGSLTKLRDLELRGTAVTDRGVERLRNLPALEELSLYCNSDITNECLKHLRAMPKLHTVGVGLTRVTAGGVEALKKDKPTLRVFR